MTLVVITGIEDLLRPSVREPVASCHHAGATIKVCTGDNVLTARSIATQCGIYGWNPTSSSEGLRHLHRRWYHHGGSRFPRSRPTRSSRGLAQSSPEDKKVLVETLRSL